MSTATTEKRSTARARLLDAANELFYSEGVQTVGIDRIIERAGVAKASLYNLFGSKEELVAAYLASRQDQVTGQLTDAMSRVDDPRQKILAAFDAQAARNRQPGYRGCAFIAASTEAPSGGLVERASDQFRADMRALFTDLAERAGAPDPPLLGRQLHLLYDGAALASRMDHHDPEIGPATRHAVEALLDAHLPKRRRPAARH